MRRKSKREKAEFHVGGNTLKGGKTKKKKIKKNGPDWALSVLEGVVSSVLSSSVVLCWLQCDWLQLGSGVWVIYWISRYGRQQVSERESGVLLECCVVFFFVSTRVNEQCGPTTVQGWGWGKGPRLLKKCDLGRLVSISVAHLLYWKMSVTTSVWVDAVSSLVSVSVGCRQ